MTLLGRLRSRIARERFAPTPLSVIYKPDYIIRRGLISAVKEAAPIVTGDLLDFGCGSKPYASLFSNARSYVGVDLATTGHDHRDSRIDVFYDGRSLPFPDEHFDGVVSFEVFEHVFNLSEVIQEICRVTKVGGCLLVSIPFAWPEHEAPFDFARYTSFGIRHLLEAAGYEVVTVKKTTSALLATFQVLIAYLMDISPRVRVLRYLRQVCFIFPCTLAAFALDAILPKRYQYFCNCLVLAKKVSRRDSGAAILEMLGT